MRDEIVESGVRLPMPGEYFNEGMRKVLGGRIRKVFNVLAHDPSRVADWLGLNAPSDAEAVPSRDVSVARSDSQLASFVLDSADAQAASRLDNTFAAVDIDDWRLIDVSRLATADALRGGIEPDWDFRYQFGSAFIESGLEFELPRACKRHFERVGAMVVRNDIESHLASMGRTAEFDTAVATIGRMPASVVSVQPIVESPAEGFVSLGVIKIWLDSNGLQLGVSPVFASPISNETGVGKFLTRELDLVLTSAAATPLRALNLLSQGAEFEPADPTRLGDPFGHVRLVHEPTDAIVRSGFEASLRQLQTDVGYVQGWRDDLDGQSTGSALDF